MRTAKLMSTVAAALLLSAGAASAQGMNKDNPERAPAAQQNAPAEKVAPSMKAGEQKGAEQKGGEHKAPQTTGQATPDAKSGKETTGQAPKSSADDKGPMQNRSMEKDKSGAAPTGQTTTEQNRTTTGQGAAGSAKLTTEQHTKITAVIKQQKVQPVNLNVSVTVGTRVPTSVHLYSLPQEVIVIYPEWRGYDYILVGDQIVIINPRTHEIVAIVQA